MHFGFIKNSLKILGDQGDLWLNPPVNLRDKKQKKAVVTPLLLFPSD
jgi:hypothetical protein